MAKLKKGSAAAKAFMAKIRAKKKVAGVKPSNRQTGASNKKIDKRMEAKKPGKRLVKSGKTSHVYYERRANRSDKGKMLGIGAMQKDFNTKYNIVINQLARAKGEIAELKELVKHEKTKLQKDKIRDKIKVQQIAVKYLSSMKIKLSKLK